eukprot:CAMPEP_0196572834 /NCGR_PEP_ID=MMETSP1081-20130531/2815_1 /TAXON_ID=36882 /ORGANISM="Pyramimonas amylifera, Strain CCMP720" /LENGTH=103 /DNA_ID=CAMNT_0041890291 /DNA_START=12 /DNA_END=323 /DNA_ORIENTATION=-
MSPTRGETESPTKGDTLSPTKGDTKSPTKGETKSPTKGETKSPTISEDDGTDDELPVTTSPTKKNPWPSHPTRKHHNWFQDKLGDENDHWWEPLLEHDGKWPI